MLQAIDNLYFEYDFITMDSGVYQLLIMRSIGEYEIEYCVRCNDLLNTLAVFWRIDEMSVLYDNYRRR